MSREFLNLLECLHFNQHVTQPTHSRERTLDLVITYGLSIGAPSVEDLTVSDLLWGTVRKRYLTSEVAANFIQILQSTPAEILPAPCDFIVDSFNHKIKSALDSVAPLLIETINTRPTPPWRNTETKKLKRNCRSAERRWRKTKLTVHYEISHGQLKTYNNAVKQVKISHFQKIINEHKNNQNSSSPQLTF